MSTVDDNWSGLKVLVELKRQSGTAQLFRRDAINDAFRLLLSLNPTEDEFDEYTGGLIFTSRMLYMIWTQERDQVDATKPT